MALLSIALAAARTWLNDDAGNNWTDASLIPKCQEAHRELQSKLWVAGSPAVRSQGATTVAAGTNFLAAVPPDMLTPFKLQEYGIAESSALATDMTEVTFLPNFGGVGQAVMSYWAWRGEAIVVVAPAANRNLLLYYRKLIPIPAASGDPIGIIFGELYIGARAAAIALGSVGNKDAYQILSQTCKENFDLVVAAQRGQQSPPMKP